MKKGLFNLLKLILAFYIIVCGLLYVFQENLIFFPQKLEKNHQFSFNQKFEEINVKTIDGISINGLLFKADR